MCHHPRVHTQSSFATGDVVVVQALRTPLCKAKRGVRCCSVGLGLCGWLIESMWMRMVALLGLVLSISRMPPSDFPRYHTPHTFLQAFKSTTTDDLLAPVLQAVVERSGVDPAALGDIVIGNVLQAGAGAVSAR